MHLPLVVIEDPSLPLYKRLQESIIQAITERRLTGGTALPSSRQLSVSTGISRRTVVRAYEELVRRGFLLTRPGGKTYVSTVDDAVTTDFSARAEGADDNAAVVLSSLSAYSLKLSAIKMNNSSAVDFPALNYGAPPPWALPIAAWKQAVGRVCANLDPSNVDYAPHPFGDVRLRQAVAGFLRRRHGVVADADQVVTFSDSQRPLVLISQLLINPGDIVVVESPGHTGARSVFELRGAQLINAPVDDEGMTLDVVAEMASKIRMIYLTPSYHDPTGVSMSIERRRQLVDLSRQHGIIIVEDAWDSSHTYISPHVPAIQSYATNENVLFIHSFWKSLYPLSMISFLVLPPHLVPVFEKAKVLLDGISPVLESNALAELISEGILERHLKSVTRQLVGMRQALIQKLVSCFGGAIQIPKQSASFWLCVRVSPFIPEPEFLKTAEKLGLTVVSTSEFYADQVSTRTGEYLIPFAFNVNFNVNVNVAQVNHSLAIPKERPISSAVVNFEPIPAALF